jgi:transcription antitermination factor NusG
MSARPSFDIPVGDGLALRIPAGKVAVPGLLWGNLAIAALMQDQGYDQVARDTLEKLQGWLDEARAADLPFPGEQTKRIGRRLTAGVQSGDERLTWYVVRATSGMERRAEDGLLEAGLVVYVPRLIRWRRTSRTKIKVTQALMGGYLFVGVRSRLTDKHGHDEDLNAIGETEHVHGVVRASALHPPIPAPFYGEISVSSILQAELDGDFDKTLRRRKDRPEVKPGDKITIVQGPFQTLSHTFLGLDEKGKVRALMNLFGRSTPTTYHPEQVAEFADD